MAKILLIETATRVCSVSLAVNGTVVSCRESTIANSHSAKITSLISEVMEHAAVSFHELDAVAVSKGPGSYTGLRIGVSTTKGICYALDIPMISVSTLQSMAVFFIMNKTLYSLNSLLCPMIDARRMEVYTALFSTDIQTVQDVSAKIIDEKSFIDLPEDTNVYFFGDGSAKCAGLFTNRKNFFFEKNFEASSVGMATIAEEKFKQGVFEDVAYFEPFYLKDFIATVPKNKVLGQ